MTLVKEATPVPAHLEFLPGDPLVPLRAGGMNDGTNIQLLCAECNLKKSGRRVVTSETYEDWYPLEESDKP